MCLESLYTGLWGLFRAYEYICVYILHACAASLQGLTGIVTTRIPTKAKESSPTIGITSERLVFFSEPHRFNPLTNRSSSYKCMQLIYIYIYIYIFLCLCSLLQPESLHHWHTMHVCKRRGVSVQVMEEQRVAVAVHTYIYIYIYTHLIFDILITRMHWGGLESIRGACMAWAFPYRLPMSCDWCASFPASWLQPLLFTWSCQLQTDLHLHLHSGGWMRTWSEGQSVSIMKGCFLHHHHNFGMISRWESHGGTWICFISQNAITAAERWKRLTG